METCHLRVFPYPELESDENCAQEACVSVRLGDLLPIVAKAVELEQAWIRDFEDDEIRITSDLFEVVRALSEIRQPA